MTDLSGLVDSHFHSLSMSGKGQNTQQAIEDFFGGGGAGLLDVAVDVEDWEPRQALADRFPRLWLAAGVHPSRAADVTDATWALLNGQLHRPKVIALGEIGLDWFRGRDQSTAQTQVFRRQLELALEHDLPVIIHNREADTDILKTLDDVDWKGRGILHCFSSDIAMAEEGLKRGFWISFAGNVTYPSAAALRSVAALVPADRMLLETDSPYLSPQGLRGQPNQPSQAIVTAQCVAEVRRVALEELLHQTRHNFETLMKVSTY